VPAIERWSVMPPSMNADRLEASTVSGTEHGPLPSAGSNRNTSRRLVTITACYLLADYLLGPLIPRRFHGLGIAGPEWNWAHKVASIALAGVLLSGSQWLRRNVGLRWHQAAGSWPFSLGCCALCVAIGCCAAALFDRPERFDWNTLLFQASMPSIAEELAVRGIALALLERRFGQDPIGGRLRFGWAAAIVTLLFGLAHGFTFNGGRVHFNIVSFIFPTIFGGIFALVRIRSGSLVWPMLCHSAANLSVYAAVWSH